jgi:hypothetical protein
LRYLPIKSFISAEWELELVSILLECLTIVRDFYQGFIVEVTSLIMLYCDRDYFSLGFASIRQILFPKRLKEQKDDIIPLMAF